MGFFRHIGNLISFTKLPRPERQVVFYSEGRNYWPHLGGLVNGLLDQTNIGVCYITSDAGDPGLAIDHRNFHAFLTDQGFIRNWLFENIETDVFVMTMPDLHKYQVKRSRHPVHYVYIQHSLVSLHMVYREGAFDHFDTVFCAGPHHVREVRAMEAKYGLPEKKTVEHGYARLDAILEAARSRPQHLPSHPPHALIAPSWGPTCTIESGMALRFVDQLIETGHKVTLRPHPETIKHSPAMVREIVKRHGKNALFAFEDNVAGQESLHESDFMISDWSGAALDYAFGLGKPVLFADVPPKVNNPNYQEVGLEPIEAWIREDIGAIIGEESDIAAIAATVSPGLEGLRQQHVFNPGRSDAAGVEHIRQLIEEMT